MSERPYELVQTPAVTVARVRVRGRSVLASPLLNRGTAFTPEEREALGLTGLLPSGVSTMEAQLRRTYAQFGRQADDLGKNVSLANLRDRCHGASARRPAGAGWSGPRRDRDLHHRDQAFGESAERGAERSGAGNA